MGNLTSTLRIQLLDQVSGPSKGAANAMKNLEGAISHLGKNGARGAKNLIGQLDHLRQKAGKIGEYNALRKSLANTGLEFRHLRENAKQLQRALTDTAKPTKKMQAEMRAAQNAVKKASNAFRDQRTAAREAEQALRSFGINSRSGIVQSQKQVRSEIAKTIHKMRELEQEGRKVKPSANPKPKSRKNKAGVGSYLYDAGEAYVGGKLVQAGTDAVAEGGNLDSAINRLRNSGASSKEVLAAQASAAQVSQRYPLMTQKDAIDAWSETRSLNGTAGGGVDLGKASNSAMLIAQAKTALASSGEELSADDIRNLATVQEQSGRGTDPNGLRDVLDAYIRGKSTFGHAFSTEQWASYVKNAKSSNFSMSDPAFLRTAIARAAQGGGARIGNETAQTFSTLGGGKMTKQGANWLVDQGLISKDQIVKGGGGKFSLHGSVKGLDLLSTDPTAWAQQVLLPGIEKSGTLSPDKIKKRMDLLHAASPGLTGDDLEERAVHGLVSDSLAKSGFRQTVIDNLAHAIGNQVITERQVAQMNGAKGLDAANTVGQNPIAAMQELMNSVANFGAVLTGPAVQAAGPIMHDLAAGIAGFANSLQDFQKNHPEIAKALGVAAPAAAGTAGVAILVKSAKSIYQKFKNLTGKGSPLDDIDPTPGTAGGLGDTLLKGAGEGLFLGILEKIGERGIKYGLDSLNADIYTPDQLRKRDAYLNNMSTYPGQSGMPWFGPGKGPGDNAGNPTASRYDALDDFLNPSKPPHPDQQLADLAPTADPAAGSDAASKTMDGFNLTMQSKADDARAIMAKLMSDIQAMATTVVAPTIRPKIDMSAISGLHADVGV